MSRVEVSTTGGVSVVHKPRTNEQGVRALERGLARASIAFLLAWAGGCDEPHAEYATSESSVCAVDEDGDGYGLGCPRGPDCNDGDPSKADGCEACDTPSKGCACEPGSAPLECITQELLDHDTLLCNAGQRYCQDGVWSECLGVTSFEAPVTTRKAGHQSQALVDQDASTATCSPCRPSCFPVEDPLDVVDGGLDPSNSTNISWVGGGGITVAETSAGGPQLVGSDEDCASVLPGDSDCDGIPDGIDGTDGKNQGYGTVDETVYMDLAPGETESALVDLPVFLHAVDLYFLLDTSEGHGVVAPALAAALSTGSFITDDANVTCADTDFDGAPNDELKTAGIVGNLACLVRDARLGTGWVREIPFTGPDASGVRYGDADEQLFEHRLDLGASAAALSSTLLDYTIDPNQGGPNAPIQALYGLATGAEAYVGWDRPAVPARSGCAAGTFGYPCFRESALPVVALFTGAPLYAGPSTASGNLGMNGALTYPRDYPASLTAGQVHAGSYAHYLPVPNNNETLATAYKVALANGSAGALGNVEDDFVTFTGDTRGMAADIPASAFECSSLGAASGPDAVFEFQVGSAKTLTLSTAGTRFANVLGITKQPTGGVTEQLMTEDTSAMAGVADTLASALFLPELPKGVRATLRGNSAGAGGEYPREWLGCYEHATFGAGDDSSDYGPDVHYRFHVAQDMRLNFSALAGGFAKSISLFEGTPGLGDYGATGTDVVLPSSEEQSLPQNMVQNAARVISGYTGTGITRTGNPLSTVGLAGDVSGTAFTAAGCTPDTEFAPDALFNFSTSFTSRMHIETSGDAAGMAPDFAHMIGLYRLGTPGTLLACGQDNLVGVSGGPVGSRAVIEQTLPAGNYVIVVRGVSASDAGKYRLTVRDMNAAPTPVACQVNAPNAPTFVEHDLVACKAGFTAPCPGNEQEYTLVLRGFDSGDAQGGDGNYTIEIVDSDLGGTVDVCGLSGVATSYTGEFGSGTYRAIVKGLSASDAGWYQLTVGDASLATASDFSDLRTWNSQVHDQLQQSGVRVLGVQLGGDGSLGEQLATVASETQALSSTGQPLVVSVDPGDAQLTEAFGRAVVGNVQQLAAAERMDVSIRLVASPDAPTPAFTFAAHALDEADDGCLPPVNDVHIDCEPGATPRFQVDFGNPPAPGNVPLNAADPHGGYWMTLELVGDGSTVIERIPVYVVPGDVSPEPPTSQYAVEGTYHQDFGALNCAANEQADWDTLEWSATLPTGTTLVWKMCMADTRAELDTCTPETLASVTPGIACAVDSDCAMGFCQANQCQHPVGPACSEDSDCGSNGECVASLCRWTALPIDPYPLAKSGQRYVRLAAELHSTIDGSAAPIVYQWRMEYECGQSE